MRITRIRLTDFKRHAQLDIEPAAGLTVVRGPNESGKSSLRQAIELVLFREADADGDDIRGAHAWTSSAAPVVALDFEVDGKQGHLVKRFDGARSDAELRLDGRSSRDYALIQEQIAELTGVPTESFFRATASVGHAELSQLSVDDAVITNRLQELISGADRSTAKARKKLELAIRNYRTEGARSAGRIEVLREEMAMLEGELATGEAALASLEADRARWVEADTLRRELDAQLARHQADLSEASRAEVLAAQRDAAQDRYARLKWAAELVSESERLQRAMPASMPLAQLRSNVSRVSDLELELSELGADLDAEATAAAAAGGDPELGLPRPARWLALAAALVVVAGMVWLAIGGLVGAVLFLVLGAAAIVILVQSARLATRRRQYGLALQLAQTAAAQRHEADSARQERFRRKRRELDTAIAALGVSDAAAAAKLLAAVEKTTEELHGIEGELRGLGVDERNVRRLEEAREEAAGEAEHAREALAAMGKLAADPVASRQAAQRLVEQTTPARDKARAEADQAQGRVDANQVDADLVAGLAERLAAARDRQAALERRVLVYQGTLKAIENAERATLKTAARYLEERMGPSIAAVTDGRYDEIEIDERSLGLRVRAPETGELVAVEQLSHGSVEQLYLAARLGLVRLVTMGRRPPLLLDDPFVTFDSARAERALRLVKQLAAEQGLQVLYLTCSDRFDTLADKLIVLPAPSAERVLAAPARPRAESPPTTPTAPVPTLRFEPDPRPNPVTDAPRVGASPGRDGADPDTGIVDPFRLGDHGSEATD